MKAPEKYSTPSAGYRISSTEDCCGMASKSENLEGRHLFRNAERKNNFEKEKVGRKNSVIWYHKKFQLDSR